MTTKTPSASRPSSASKPSRAAAAPRPKKAAPSEGKARKKAPAPAKQARATTRRGAAPPEEVIRVLDELYPNAECELDFETPFQLLVATILSAQCTDKVVNTVTPALFARYPDPAALARADLADVERLVSRTGFFRQKAKNIVAAARLLVEHHGGEVPRSMDALTVLPGVARKTANVVLGTAYGMNEGFVVDTHIGRIAQRLRLTRHEDPKKIEEDLMRVFPRPQWTKLGHQIIWHGRRVCAARKPACEACPMASFCPSSTV